MDYFMVMESLDEWWSVPDGAVPCIKDVSGTGY